MCGTKPIYTSFASHVCLLTTFFLYFCILFVACYCSINITRLMSYKRQALCVISCSARHVLLACTFSLWELAARDTGGGMCMRAVLKCGRNGGIVIFSHSAPQFWQRGVCGGSMTHYMSFWIIRLEF